MGGAEAGASHAGSGQKPSCATGGGGKQPLAPSVSTSWPVTGRPGSDPMRILPFPLRHLRLQFGQRPYIVRIVYAVFQLAGIAYQIV